MPRGNKNNLIKNEDLTPEQRRENASKAGKASGEARKKQNEMKKAARLLLGMPLPESQESLRKVLKSFGVQDKDMDYNMGLIAAVMVKALKGDAIAAKFVRDSAGYNPELELKEEQFEHVKTNGSNINLNVDGSMEVKSRVQIYLPEIEDDD